MSLDNVIKFVTRRSKNLQIKIQNFVNLIKLQNSIRHLLLEIRRVKKKIKAEQELHFKWKKQTYQKCKGHCLRLRMNSSSILFKEITQI